METTVATVKDGTVAPHPATATSRNGEFVDPLKESSVQAAAAEGAPESGDDATSAGNELDPRDFTPAEYEKWRRTGETPAPKEKPDEAAKTAQAAREQGEQRFHEDMDRHPDRDRIEAVLLPEFQKYPAVNKFLGAALPQLEHPAEVLARIAQDPKTIAVMSTLGGDEVFAVLKRLDSQITPLPKVPPGPKKISDAPPPPPEVGGRATPSRDAAEEALANDDVRGFINAENAKDAAHFKATGQIRALSSDSRPPARSRR